MRRSVPWWLLALALLGGCATPVRSRSVRARVFRAASHGPRALARDLKPSPHAEPAAALVEQALHARGLRFGTDGTVGALHGYLDENGRGIEPSAAQAGDVVFFDRGGAGCADHVGLVETVEPGGRITFRELRDGELRRSFVYAAAPAARRDAAGRVLNSFLRAKRPEDGPLTRYVAGEMLCGVLRPPAR
jgi:hypothetical protein